MSTKLDNIIGLDSCWNCASLDEPLFVLRATDETSPDTIRLWAARYLLAKGGWARMTENQRYKHGDALRVADQMTAWRNKSIASNTFDDDIPF